MMLIITALLLSLFTVSPLDTQARPTEYYYNTLTRGIFKICTHAGVFSSRFSSHSGFLNFGRPLWLTRVNSLSLTLSPLKHRIDVANAHVPRVLRRVRRRRYREAVLATREDRRDDLVLNSYSFSLVSLCFLNFLALRSMWCVGRFSVSLSLSLSFLADTTTQHSCLTFFFNQAITGRLGRNIRRGDPGDSVLRSS